MLERICLWKEEEPWDVRKEEKNGRIQLQLFQKECAQLKILNSALRQ